MMSKGDFYELEHARRESRKPGRRPCIATIGSVPACALLFALILLGSLYVPRAHAAVALWGAESQQCGITTVSATIGTGGNIAVSRVDGNVAASTPQTGGPYTMRIRLKSVPPSNADLGAVVANAYETVLKLNGGTSAQVVPVHVVFDPPVIVLSGMFYAIFQNENNGVCLDGEFQLMFQYTAAP